MIRPYLDLTTPIWIYVTIPFLLTIFSADVVSATKSLTFHSGESTYNIPLTILLGIVIRLFFLCVLRTRIKAKTRDISKCFEKTEPKKIINEYAPLSYLFFISLGVFIILITVYTFKFGYSSFSFVFFLVPIGGSEDQTRLRTPIVTLYLYKLKRSSEIRSRFEDS